MSITAEKPAAPLLTYEKYLAEGEINRRYEIIDGVRCWMPNPSVRHQDILFNIAVAFKSFSRISNAGRMVIAACDVLIDLAPLKTRQPDILFISHERFGSRDPLDPSALDPAPELVVEILSPSDTKATLKGKLRDYRKVNVQECWVVNTNLLTIEVLRLTPETEESVAVFRDTDLVSSSVFPGLTVSLSDVFAP
ncbi:MAG: Uma2 family endonuclease [Janthinobacterium lividum]